ncbi:hypothetical protein GDO81_000337 [Engystomops pustulosus]|uniref:Uncharacterized protein n=1 Tax=Engystomops pustulosus TaxID=76066 RepID=A0AAV7D5D7_ENGPU|nr:hypothetical protein GDO81_000337 [Engystomops pustulosus]
MDVLYDVAGFMGHVEQYDVYVRVYLQCDVNETFICSGAVSGIISCTMRLTHACNIFKYHFPDDTCHVLAAITSASSFTARRCESIKVICTHLNGCKWKFTGCIVFAA